MERMCPRCKKPPEEGETRCPSHGLYCLPEEIARTPGAPMLGLVLPEGYALIDRLGKGAMGQVYEGLRVEGDAEPERVAVKVLRLALRDAEDERRRFEHEAELTARLSSPFIVKVHGHGVLSDARFDRVAYILLELLEGETMAERMAQRPLGPLVIADVVALRAR